MTGQSSTDELARRFGSPEQRVAALSDRDLTTEWKRWSGQVGEPDADALAAEMDKRGLDF